MSTQTTGAGKKEVSDLPSRISASPEAPESEGAIVRAAIAEFCEKGFDGARIETIAKRSGYNKSLIYRYFTDKTGLFHAAFGRKLEQRLKWANTLPTPLSDALALWFDETLADPDYLRMLQQESLGFREATIIEEASRRDYYQKLIQLVESRQEQGVISKEYRSVDILLMMTALVFFPVAFPHVAELIYGKPVNSEEFKQEWKNLLKQVAERLG